MTKNTFIGIDPGTSGGIAIIESGGGILSRKMPDNPHELAAELQWYANRNNVIAIVEQVGAARGQSDNRKQGVSSAFKFGFQAGTIHGVLASLKIPMELVSPVVWQRHFGLTRKDKSEKITAKKNRHKAKAAQLFPSQKITHATADPLLLAEYGKRTFSSAEPESHL